MSNGITIASLNVQGIGDSRKRKDVFGYIRDKKFNIYFLQDTHFTDKESKIIRSQWGYEAYFSNYSSQSRGVAILINNNFEFKLHSVEKDNAGNLLVVHCAIASIDMSLICVYGPNRDDPDFYNSLNEILRRLNNKCIIAGDFNLVLNPDIDCFNYVNINNPKARDTVLSIILEHNLIDCWREQNLESRQYTWFKRNPVKKARLDMFLISSDLFLDIADTCILPGYRSDHSIVILTLKLGEFKAGKSYWKFNNSLLKDVEYVKQIKQLVQRIIQQYASDDQNQSVNDSVTNQNISLSIDDKLFLETLLMQIRGHTISYATFKKRQDNINEKTLIKDIEILQQCTNTENENALLNKQQELQDIRKKRLEGSLIRSRAKWVLEVEKPTRYFCNLENRHFVSKNMATLFNK